MTPCDYKDYPPNWKTEIRPRILARAKNKCEACGVENGWLTIYPGIVAARRAGYIVKGSARPEAEKQVVLTIAHKCHDRTLFVSDDAYNSDGNLAALCQRCHLRLDRWHHAETRRKTQNAKTGQTELEVVRNGGA